LGKTFLEIFKEKSLEMPHYMFSRKKNLLHFKNQRYLDMKLLLLGPPSPPVSMKFMTRVSIAGQKIVKALKH
jgi:hypothetical protein